MKWFKRKKDGMDEIPDKTPDEIGEVKNNDDITENETLLLSGILDILIKKGYINEKDIQDFIKKNTKK